jgi:hypothetical protein
MIAHADDALDATKTDTGLSDEEILHGTGKGAAAGIIHTRPARMFPFPYGSTAGPMVRLGLGNTKNLWKKHGKIIHSGGAYIKQLDPRTLGAQTRSQMKQNHTGSITRNSRCPCGSGKRFKRCCGDSKR